jgi:hypothetical protein
MKRYYFLLAVLFGMSSFQATAQCDKVTEDCAEFINQEYISDGQAYWAMIKKDDVAEFQTTLFGGNTYRIAACSATKGSVIFKVLDPEKNELFSSSDFGNAPYWDFVVEGTITVNIEATLDPTRNSDSGCAVLLIGFKK